MKHAYNQTWLGNLLVVKEAKGWFANHAISEDQLQQIRVEYRSNLYHPNFIIRILLFIATIVALLGVSGLLALMIQDISEQGIFQLMFVYGIVSMVILDFYFVRKLHHYKSGVTEALLYHSMLFIILGVATISEFHTYATVVACLFVFSFAAFRYLDLISTTAALCSFVYFIFQSLYDIGGTIQHFIPLVLIAVFTPLYFYFKKLKNRDEAEPWIDCLIVSEAFSLVTIYAAGNYLVVRELSVSLMDLYLEEGSDIPFAFIFYGLTVIIPMIYLYAAIRNKDIVLLRVSLAALAFSVFTFKYYYSTGHHEITFTVGGTILIAAALLLFRYLRRQRNGYTRENILKEKWASANPEAFVISQTLGGNKVQQDDSFHGGGGGFGGGGTTGGY
jgi:hypothetical protein